VGEGYVSLGTLKMRDIKCRTGKCGTKLQRVENAGMEKREKKIIWHHAYRMQNLFVFLAHLQRVTHDTESWHEIPPLQEKQQPIQRRPNKSVRLLL